MKKILALALALSLMLMTAAFALETADESPAEITVGGSVSTADATFDGSANASKHGFLVSWEMTPAQGTNGNSYYWDANDRMYKQNAVTETNWSSPVVSITVTNYGTQPLTVNSSFTGTGIFAGKNVKETTPHWEDEELIGFDAQAYFEANKSNLSSLTQTISYDDYDDIHGAFEIDLGTTYCEETGASFIQIGTFTVTAAYAN